ncbi:hypothetical protein SAMN05421678_102109 [Actinopolymorpha cephalotaxi]|uniref:MFS family permease n=1 Tax=Actinopolymorpha cephalotaxi TaxID=504797 RepID=A0A1I2LK35_9ACTN|nr:hypothetical protein [Actinopolymorpha cephalotaxi]NYH84919.1 MFS family permease [Actinopolymorpha cephalotaxi]SFF77797.1 hypothetical protein SAMN05421678_102109 [Actinopolymorpha cephalotaxi]
MRPRALVALYPPAWRERYGEEFAALLEDTGVHLRQVLDVLPAAASAWIRPAAHLHDRAARMRASVTMTLFAWVTLTAGTVVFGQLHDDSVPGGAGGGLRAVYVACAAASTVALVLGGLPLAGAVVRAGRRRVRTVAALGVPVVAAAGFLAVAVAVTRLVPHSPRPGVGIGTTWFLALTAVGAVAALTAASGPAAAFRRTPVTGRPLVAAVVAGAVAVVSMAAAAGSGLAAVVVPAVTGPSAPGGLPGPLLAYGAGMALTLVVAATSCVRGLRAATPNRRSGHGQG